jgi:phage shock protein PspC (stress-responsive transcriptional regulator)
MTSDTAQPPGPSRPPDGPEQAEQAAGEGTEQAYRPTEQVPITPPPLARPDDRVVAGVAAGVARRLGIDTTLVRVVVVVLSLFGVGVGLYAVGWLLMPDERTGRSIFDEAADPQSSDRTTPILMAVGLGIIAVVALGLLLSDSLPEGLILLALLMIGVALLLRRGTTARPPELGPNPAGGSPNPPPGGTAAGQQRPSASPEANPYEYAGTAGGYAWRAAPGSTSSVPPVPPTGPPVAPEPKPTGHLGMITFFAAVLAVGLLGVLDASGRDFPVAVYPAVVLLVSGIGLLVGTWWGRARGLIALGLLAAVAIGPAAAIDWASDVDFAFDENPRVIAPRTLADVDGTALDLGAGEFRYDLTDVDFDGGQATASIDMLAGQLVVVVPRDVTVDLDATVVAGQIRTPGNERSGLGVDVEDVLRGVPENGELELSVDMLAGEMEIVR